MPSTDEHSTTSAAGLREQLELLERERATVLLAGLDANGRYMADLLGELEAVRSAYAGAAVTEIASLRSAVGAALIAPAALMLPMVLFSHDPRECGPAGDAGPSNALRSGLRTARRDPSSADRPPTGDPIFAIDRS